MHARVSAAWFAAMLDALVASPAGFEPTAPGLGILCSILLSYGDLTDFQTVIPPVIASVVPVGEGA